MVYISIKDLSIGSIVGREVLPLIDIERFISYMKTQEISRYLGRDRYNIPPRARNVYMTACMECDKEQVEWLVTKCVQKEVVKE